MDEFLDRFTELLDERKINRLNLSKLINVSSTTLNGYYSHGYLPRLDVAIKLVNFFDCSLDYLFAFSNDKKKKYNLDAVNCLAIFNKNLEHLRKETDISIAKLMKTLNMSEDNYYRWRKGMIPKMNSIILLAKYFDVSLDEFLAVEIR